MRLDPQSHEMSRSFVFHKIEMWPRLQVGDKQEVHTTANGYKTKGGWFAVLWMAAAVAARPSQAKKVHASVNFQTKVDFL